jgi:hypothetical protein
MPSPEELYLLVMGVLSLSVIGVLLLGGEAYLDYDEQRVRKKFKKKRDTELTASLVFRPSGVSVRKRITWYLEERTAVSIPAGDGFTSMKFEWGALPLPRADIPVTAAGVANFRDFLPEENKVRLLEDGVPASEFLDIIALKTFIIRFAYDIGEDVLIPSELLADAGLIYATGDWVDEWGCRDKNNEIIESRIAIIYRPPTRKLRSGDGFSRQGSGGSRAPSKIQVPILRARIDRRARFTPKVEILDTECFYTFRAGGFYEKNQDPLESSCEKGETAI